MLRAYLVDEVPPDAVHVGRGDPLDDGLAAPGMAAVVNEARRSISPVVSLYVNDFNAPARAAYRRAGFREVGEFMSVLF